MLMKKFFIGFAVLLVAGMVLYGFMIGSLRQEKYKPLPSMLRLQESVRNYYRNTGSAPSGLDVLINQRYVSEGDLKDKNGRPLMYSYNSETGKCKIICVGEGQPAGSAEDNVLEFDPAAEEPKKDK